MTLSLFQKHFTSVKFLPLLLILSCISCGSEKDKEIEKVNRVIYTLIEADNNSDIKTVLSSYTDSIEFYPAGREFVKGIENIRSSYEQLFRENKLQISTKIIKTTVFGDDAMVTGINTGTKKSLIDSSITNLNDNYIALLERDHSGNWKISKLIWRSNVTKAKSGE